MQITYSVSASVALTVAQMVTITAGTPRKLIRNNSNLLSCKHILKGSKLLCLIILYEWKLDRTASTLYALCLCDLYAQCVQCRDCKTHVQTELLLTAFHKSISSISVTMLPTAFNFFFLNVKKNSDILYLIKFF